MLPSARPISAPFRGCSANHCTTKQRPEGRDGEQPQENLVLGSQRGEEECVAAIGVSAAPHPICPFREGWSFVSLSGVNQRWAMMVGRTAVSTTTVTSTENCV